MAHTEITPQKKQAFMTVLFAVLSYNFKRPNRSAEEAGTVLVNNPDVAEALASHRFPLDGVTEAFATAAACAIKVVFDVGSP